MANSFVVSGKGFYKDSYIDENHQKCHVWTNKIREAKLFPSSSALSLISKLDIDAFLYKPFEEEPINKDRYRVVRRGSFTDISDETNHECLEYMVQKVMTDSITDAKFLNTRKSNVVPNYTLEEATELCKRKNTMILDELKNKMGL